MFHKIISPLLLFFFLPIFLSAQTEYDLAKVAVMDYIDGTAYGDIERIKRAFHPDAALYAANPDGSLRLTPISQYVTFFTPGKATGRRGHIVSLDLVENAANAKLEIDMGTWRYTDYLLLLRLEEGWKIVHKSYTREPFERKGNILFVVSSADHFGDSNQRTGAHFGEIVHPYHYFSTAGYEVDIVSPEGGAVPVSYVQLQDELQKRYFYDTKLSQKLSRSLVPAQVDPKRYDAVYYAGGSAAMFDLPQNPDIMEITRSVYEEQEGIVAAVCHGPAGLVNVRLSDGSYLVEGKRINGFTNEEESQSGKKKLLPFLLQSRLEERGGLFEKSDPWTSHVAVDGRLVTGQNPASCEKLAKEVLRLLEQRGESR